MLLNKAQFKRLKENIKKMYDQIDIIVNSLRDSCIISVEQFDELNMINKEVKKR